MTETIAIQGFAENRTTSDSSNLSRPIPNSESDALIARIKELQGNQSASAFARRCGFRESVLRGYLTEGKRPGLDYLVAMANAGSVTVDWLATGRLPKTRVDQRKFMEAETQGEALSRLPIRLGVRLGAAIERAQWITDNTTDHDLYLEASAELIMDITGGNPDAMDHLAIDQEALDAVVRLSRTILGFKVVQEFSSALKPKPSRKGTSK